MKNTDLEKAEKLFEKGEKWLRFGKYDYDYLPLSKELKAIRYFEQTIELNPQHQEAWSHLSSSYERCAFDLKDPDYYQKALEASAKRLELDPQNSYSWLTRRQLLKNLLDNLQGRSSPYDFLAETAKELYPDLQVLQEEMLNCFDQQIPLEADPKTSLHLKGYLLEEMKRYAEALEIFLRLIELEPDKYFTYYIVSKLYQSTGDFEKALEFFEIYEKHEKVQISPLSQKAKILENLGRSEDANEVYLKILQMIDEEIAADPDYRWNYSEKSKVLEKLGRYAEAVECCQKLIENIDEVEEYDDEEGSEKLDLQQEFEERMNSLKSHQI